MTDMEIEKYICELLNIKNIYEISKCNAKLRDEMLSKLGCFKNVPVSQLSRIIGINRKMLERKIKK